MDTLLVIVEDYKIIEAAKEKAEKEAAEQELAEQEKKKAEGKVIDNSRSL